MFQGRYAFFIHQIVEMFCKHIVLIGEALDNQEHIPLPLDISKYLKS